VYIYFDFARSTARGCVLCYTEEGGLSSGATSPPYALVLALGLLSTPLLRAMHHSVRGAFRFNRNQYPIQNYYLRVVGKDSQGRLVNKTIGTVFKDHGDAYVQDCAMK